MVSIEEALKLIRQQEVDPSVVELPLQEVVGYYLAKGVDASFDLPSFDNSAMDGYAICGSGKHYEIVGEVAAGNTASSKLSDGQAVRIFTGGKVPVNTTAVVMQEKTSVTGSQLQLHEPEVPGKNIRRRGEEITAGQKVFEAGHRINAASLGVLSSFGIERVAVFKKPTVRIMTTGNELIAPGQVIKEGQIYESNSWSLEGALQDCGFHCEKKQQLPDDLEAISHGVAENLSNCEVLLISGGISVGAYDFVKQAMEANGVIQIFHKVLQKPGKPLYFGRKGDRFVFALPGNPASALTCFYIYVLPILQKQAGGSGGGLQRIRLPLSHEHHFTSDRPTFLKANIIDHHVSILEGQGSSMIHSLARSNALVYIKGPAQFVTGDLVECFVLSQYVN